MRACSSMFWFPVTCLLLSGFFFTPSSAGVLTVNASTLLESSKINRKCLRDVVLYETAVMSAQPWAMQMLDSTSKLPDGLLYGNTNQLGNFEECLTVSVPLNFDFHTQFCRASVTLAATEKLHQANQIQHAAYIANRTKGALLPHVRCSFCLPSSCAASDVEIVGERLLPALLNLAFNLDVRIEASVNPAECYLPDKPALPPKFWAFMYVDSIKSRLN
ncbi:hypothetical protein B566_EDAN018332 [Ephemera danica]|nr:hypothetical protein B566_EDAN018332 [Ephemera danica]